MHLRFSVFLIMAYDIRTMVPDSRDVRVRLSVDTSGFVLYGTVLVTHCKENRIVLLGDSTDNRNVILYACAMNQSAIAKQFTVNTQQMFPFSSEDFASVGDKAEWGFVGCVNVNHALRMQLLK
jgi:hypothetical protein